MIDILLRFERWTRIVSVTQTTVGRFHHFHLARQLEKRGLLDEIWTGYPRFKLNDEFGIPRNKIRSFPWIHTVLMAKGRLALPTPFFDRELVWLSQVTLDRYVSRQLKQPRALIALSGSGLRSGKIAKTRGGIYFCDRGSTHIRFQERILREEYQRWKVPFNEIDPRMVDREEAEYELADRVSVPSAFVARTFIEMGVPGDKLFLNPYGARLDRFQREGEPELDSFTILFVGEVSLRKGFLYLLEAFQRLKHPRKCLKVIGSISPSIKPLLAFQDLSGVDFLGLIPNSQLIQHYSTAHVMVLPSIEEGFGMVIGEALACGCPVIASTNTGAADFFSNGIEGFIVPPRSGEQILQRFQQLIDDKALQQKMSEAATVRVKSVGGWDGYGNRWVTELQQRGISS